MQFLDIAINTVSIASVGFFTVQFVAGLMNRRRVSPGQLSLNFDAPEQAIAPSPVTLEDWQWVEPAMGDDAVLVEQFSQFIADYWQRRHAVDTIVPFVHPQKRQQQAIDWASFSPIELRKVCQQRSIKWRNAHGLNRHLSKAEMVQALSKSSAA